MMFKLDKKAVAETDLQAAHDLLSLSKSLPPLSGPNCIQSNVFTIYEHENNSATLLHKFYESKKSSYTEVNSTLPPTPPTSENSDNDNYNTLELKKPRTNSKRKRKVSLNVLTDNLERIKSQAELYSYEALISSDGRSRNKKTDKTSNRIKNCSASAKSTDTRKNKFDCTECGKQYATSSNLSRHKQTHRSLDSQSAKKCKVCGKTYVSMPALAMHLLTHRLSHSCGICGKLFSRPWLLQGHLRSHSGEKPYGCAQCGKAFADRSNLRAHLQIHSIAKNFACVRCHKTFALKSYLNKHSESVCFSDESSVDRHNFQDQITAGQDESNEHSQFIDVDETDEDEYIIVA